MKQYINRRDFLKAAGVTAAAAALAGCGVTSGSTATASSTAASSTAAAGKYDDVKADVTLTMSHQMAASHSINKTAEEFARLVAEKSEGKMKVDVYSAATLGTETENLQALTNGTLDLAVIAAEFYANYVDEAGCLCLPFVYSSYDDCAEKLAGEAGTTVAQMILDKTNVRILDYYVLAFRQIFTTDKPLNTVDDMSGLIIRIPDSSTYKETFTQLGAAPTPVGMGRDLHRTGYRSGVRCGEHPRVHHVRLHAGSVQVRQRFQPHHWTHHHLRFRAGVPEADRRAAEHPDRGR